MLDVVVIYETARRHQWRPQNFSAERDFEVLDRSHCDGIDHLLMETRVARIGVQAVIGNDIRVLEVYRRVVASGRRVVIDDFQVLANWTRLESLPDYRNDDLIALDGLQLLRQAWISCIRAQATVLGLGSFDHLVLWPLRSRRFAKVDAGNGGHCEAFFERSFQRLRCVWTADDGIKELGSGLPCHIGIRHRLGYISEIWVDMEELRDFNS